MQRLNRKPLESVLVKPAGPDCNMACEYCFYLEKASLFHESTKHRMSEDILEEMVRQVLAQSGKNVSFGWQGGEPTLMGLPFFEKAVDLQRKYGTGKVVGNGLQTNGILIDDPWIDFLKEYNFLVGLSLDGPEYIHDKYRRLVNGKGTWTQVVKKAEAMLLAGVAVNALSVINDHSVNYPEEIYSFLKEKGLDYMQFIPCMERASMDQDKVASFSVPPEKFGTFLCRIFDLWINDFEDGAPTTSVRFFDSVFYSYVGLTPPECTLMKNCGVYVVVEHNGDVYSCDFFVDPEHKLGNIKDSKLVDLLNSASQRQFGKSKSDLPEVCRGCQWLKYCRGGCLKDRLRDPKNLGHNYFCASYKMFFLHAHETFCRIADEWKANQAQEEALQGQPQGQYRAEASKKPGRNDPCPCGSGLKFKKCCGRG